MQEIGTSLLASHLPALARELERLPGAVIDVTETRGDVSLIVQPERIRDLVRFLKQEPSLAFNLMMDLFGVDYLKYQPEHPARYAVVYNLYSFPSKTRVFLKAYLPEEKPEIDSLHDLYKAANWFEREAWDLFGIVFRGHPNLVRILCHTDFEGHPLRKDYPSDKYQRLKSASPSTGF